MKRIGLIDCDHRNGNKFPNLALMKISAYFKKRGDEVSWYNPFDGWYDTVYISKVFSFSPDYDEAIHAGSVVRGGTGYQIQLVDGKECFISSGSKKSPFGIKLNDTVEHIYPDYDLYPTLCKDTAYGFLTRGCPRGCSFCHVAAKEGLRSVKVADLNEFWDWQKNIVLLDPNILACKDRIELLQQLRDSKANIDFNQGLDARMLNEEVCDLLSEIRIKNVHFAWDRYQDGAVILPKLKMFANCKYPGKNPDHHAIVYTLVNFDTTLEEDLDRIYTLRDMGYWAYVMIYDKEHCDNKYKALQRWCNNRIIFASCKRFEDYKK